MSIRARTWTHISIVRQYPFDLAVVSIAAACLYVLVTSTPPASPIRLLSTGLIVLFLPGYALVSVLFPATERGGARRTSGAPGGINVVERLGLSLVLSLTAVALLALALPATGWALGTEPLAAGLGAITIVLAQLGAVRRLRTPPADRFVVSPVDTLERLRTARGTVGTLSSVLLVVAITMAAGALLLGVLVPASAGGFTELGLYTETDDGEVVAGEIPDEVAPGDEIPVAIAIENHEGERTDYTVVVQQTTLEDDEVVDRTRLEEISATVPDGETGTSEQSIAPTAADGDTVRVDVLLYQDEPADEPTAENAVVDTYFWVTVTEDAETAAD